MKLMYALASGAIGTGMPVTTMDPWDEGHPPRLMIGEWLQPEGEAVDDDDLKFEGVVVEIDPSVPLHHTEDGRLYVKDGNFVRDTKGLRLVASDPKTANDIALWVDADGYSPHGFTTDIKASVTTEFTVKDCEIIYCDDGNDVIAVLRTGGRIALSETQKVRLAGTGRAFCKFSKHQNVTRTVVDMVVGELTVDAVIVAWNQGRPSFPVSVELYRWGRGAREVVTVQSSVTERELQNLAQQHGFKHYDKVVVPAAGDNS